jgi:hypothetical protein
MLALETRGDALIENRAVVASRAVADDVRLLLLATRQDKASKYYAGSRPAPHDITLQREAAWRSLRSWRVQPVASWMAL